MGKIRTGLPTEKEIAYHEAAHAVACVVQDLSMKEVTIEPGKIEGCLGHITHHSPEGYDFRGSRARGQKKVARQMVIVCYAGFEAQQRLNPSASDEHSQIDVNDASSLLNDYHVYNVKKFEENNNYIYDFIDKLRDEARRLVKREWSAIEAVASRLLEKRTLSELEVKSICKCMTTVKGNSAFAY